MPDSVKRPDNTSANNIEDLALQATDARQRLIKSGYQPIPTRAKQALVVGWNNDGWVKTHLTDNAKGTAITRAAKWPKLFLDREGRPLLSTGSRLVNGLGAIDGDVDDEVMSEKLFEIIEAVAPDVAARAPVRYGKGDNKFAMFVRIEGDTFGSLPHNKFYKPGEEDGDDHCVEVFGSKPNWQGHCHRQFVVHGPHSYDEDGVTVLSSYAFSSDRPSLLDTPLQDLPALTKVQALEIITRFELAATAHGWIKVERPAAADTAGQVYSITDQTRFNTDKGGHGIDYTTLCEQHACYGDIRCASSFIDGRSGTKTTRCWVFWSERHQCVAVYVFGDEQTHYPVDAKPTGAAAAVLGQIKPPPPPPPPSPPPSSSSASPSSPPPSSTGLPADMPPQPRNMTNAEQNSFDDDAKELLAERFEWLLKTHSFEGGQVVNFYLDAMTRHPNGLSERAARSAFMNWHITIPAPKPHLKPTPIYAFNVWLRDEARIRTVGMQMRPDKEFPLFEEGGTMWRNRYRAPQHDKVNVTAAQVMRAERLFTALARNIAARDNEFRYLMQHVAYKMRNPAVPGCAILFVNPAFGSGRDVFFAIVAALLGEANCTKQDINKLIGKDGRVFNAWVANRVLTYVPEVLDPEHARGTYERLKSLADPRSGLISVNSKGVEEYDGRRFSTLWFATNHTDALRLEDDDRRISVLMGHPARLDEALAEELESWRADPVNVAALWRYLMTVDLAGYKPHIPIETDAKMAMIDATKDPVRRTLQLLEADEKRTWKVFTLQQLEAEVETAMGLHGASRGDLMRNISLRHRSARANLVVPVPSSTKHGRVMRVDGQPSRLYCFVGEVAVVAKLDDDELREAMPDAAMRRTLEAARKAPNVTPLKRPGNT